MCSGTCTHSWCKTPYAFVRGVWHCNRHRFKWEKQISIQDSMTESILVWKSNVCVHVSCPCPSPTPVQGVTGLCPSSDLLPASTKTMPCMQSTWAAALSNALFSLADFILCCPARCMCLGPSIPKATCLQATRPVQALSLCIHHCADSLLLCNGPSSPPIWCVLHLAMQGDWCIGAQAQSRSMSGTFLFFPSIIASEAAWFAEEGTRNVKYHKDHSYCAVE